MNEELTKLINQADNYFETGDFKKAQKLYEEAFEEVGKALEESKLICKIAKGVGWVAALLTGGFGVEDVLIVPAVSKGIQYLFGIDPSELVDALKYVSYQELCSIANGELWDVKDEYYYLKKFALLYQNGDKNPLKVITDLYLPTYFSSDEESFVSLTPIIRNNAIMKIIEVKFNENVYTLKLNDLIYTYASYFGWDFVEMRKRSKKRNREKRKDKFSEDGINEETACELLGVSKNATEEEINRAYHQKVSE